VLVGNFPETEARSLRPAFAARDPHLTELPHLFSSP
jgi:hypothetical protein